jgi:dUTP pyrophosphatase
MIRYYKYDDKAVEPVKAHATDVGYDLYAIAINKLSDNIYELDSGIAVEAPTGYYFQLYPRSSLFKYGFIHIGSGVIDRGYTGRIKLIVQKINTTPIPEIPFKCMQLVPHKTTDVEFIKSDELWNTDRGTAGFGSTDISKC